jgi:hypothetical protein
MGHGQTHELKNPGPYRFSPAVRPVLIVLILIGVLSFGFGLVTDAKRAWASFLHEHFFFMSLAIGGVFLAAINYITGAMWATPLKRIYESFMSYLPFVVLTFIAIVVGIHQIYEWTHPEFVKGDIVLEGKAGYLNITFFVIRNLVALAIWIFFSMKILKNSREQDQTKAYALTVSNQRLAPVFLILFAITYTMVSFDQLMSLDPHWFSTIFGVYCFAGMFYSTLALTGVVTVLLKKRGALEGFVNENHLHDVGKYMFAFTVFWAYIGFSQFMLIWYANMPEETGYFLTRLNGGWLWVSVFLLLGKFVTPFILLLPRDAKRSEDRLLWVGLFMIFAQWIDVMWMVQPEFFKSGPSIGWIEIGTLLGFVGVFGMSMVRYLSRNNLVAIGDPRLPDAVFHHHQ